MTGMTDEGRVAYSRMEKAFWFFQHRYFVTFLRSSAQLGGDLRLTYFE